LLLLLKPLAAQSQADITLKQVFNPFLSGGTPSALHLLIHEKIFLLFYEVDYESFAFFISCSFSFSLLVRQAFFDK